MVVPFPNIGDPLNSIRTKNLDMASGDCGSTPRRVIAAFRADADSLSVDEPLAPPIVRWPNAGWRRRASAQRPEFLRRNWR